MMIFLHVTRRSTPWVFQVTVLTFLLECVIRHTLDLAIDQLPRPAIQYLTCPCIPRSLGHVDSTTTALVELFSHVIFFN